MADFRQAVMWMEEGKKVFRNNWRDKTFHIFEKRTYYLSSDKKDFTFHREDFEATDWEIYAEKRIKKFGHFEIWNDGLMRIRSPAIKNESIICLFPCDIIEMESAIKFQKDVFSEDNV